jgi:two-component system CheB/CheR fusion protein
MLPVPPFPIVAIGGSAGSIPALLEFFSRIPADAGAAFVVVIHLDPEHASELSEVIGTRTPLPITQVNGTTPLEKNHIYVIPPNRRLYLSEQDLRIAEFEEARGFRAPIDLFFRSVAETYHDGFGIILSGAGSDGSIGVNLMKESGAIILVQDPNEAPFNSMPRSAIALGSADFVLPAAEIATQVVELIRTKQNLKPPEDDDEEVIVRILAYLRVRTGHDFSQYKRASLMRRMSRRMQVVRATSLRDYLTYLREHSGEAQALFEDILIAVTKFFRDSQFFDKLAKIVVAPVFDKKNGAGPIRVWVPACATGEEAYSVAMLLLEEASRREIRPEIQVFATDLDAHALAIAREGCYPASISTDVTDERLRRFFILEGDEYRIRREVRDLLVFSLHNVLRDPPFSRVDVVCCRNFLIYINRELQHKVLNTFHYALLPDGFLFLGSSETAEHPDGLFRPLDRVARIYQSTGKRVDDPIPFPQLLRDFRPSDTLLPRLPTEGSKPPGIAEQHRQALAEFAPPSMLVDEMHRIVHLSEGAGQYMNVPPGTPTFDSTKFVRQELSAELSIGLHRAFEEGQSSFSLPISVQFNGHSRNVCLQVSPVHNAGSQPKALVLFIEAGPAEIPIDQASDEGKTSDTLVKQLQEELAATRGHLKHMRQQYETATENLRAANEELQSINEEYRSTAEELETSHEELQSMNEELQTLNAELKLKLDAVSSAHNDLENLIIATDFATLFLDRNLCIKRFTPTVREYFNINARDEGRKITDFTNQLDYPEFERDLMTVMQNGEKFEKEIPTANHLVLMMRIRPYRTADTRIDGVVVTFVDLTNRQPEEKTN